MQLCEDGDSLDSLVQMEMQPPQWTLSSSPSSTSELLHDQQIEMPNNPTLKSAAYLLKAAFCCKYCQSSGSKAPDCLRAIPAMEFKLSVYPHQPLTCRESRHAIIRLSILARKLDKTREENKRRTFNRGKFKNQWFC